MKYFKSGQGMTTLMNHIDEGLDPLHSHINPIYQTSAFRFPDAETGAATFSGQVEGYIYTRLNNPNLQQLADKIAVLEGLDLLQSAPGRKPEEIVSGMVFASGMSAVTTAILSRVRAGQTIIAQDALYSATYNFLHERASRFGIQVVWLHDHSPLSWEAAFETHPEAVLAYAESPVNPTLRLVDLSAIADTAHRHNAWLMVDNTFASPYCQRPLTLGADIVLHSTTKYLSGHGVVIGGAVISRHPEYVKGDLNTFFKELGGCPSPFDAWLANMGLKTFELRMQRHCENALAIARFLETHPKVEKVYYPGLENNSDHALAKRQMVHFGGMVSFELRGGLQAGISMMNNVKVCTLVVSLGNADTLITHPASMTHSNMTPEARRQAGVTDGLVRLSVGIENVDDLIADLDQAMNGK